MAPAISSIILLLLAPVSACLAVNPTSKTTTTSHILQLVDSKTDANLFVWSDTCNVYVVRDGEAALLIDLSDGSVLDHLKEIGVKRVEWVLFTHHHREQCQGAPRLKGTGVKVAAPERIWEALGEVT